MRQLAIPSSIQNTRDGQTELDQAGAAASSAGIDAEEERSKVPKLIDMKEAFGTGDIQSYQHGDTVMIL